MKFVGWVAVAAALLISTAATAAGGMTVTHYEPLRSVAIDAAQHRKLQDQGPVALSFDALGRTFDLRLEPNDRLLTAAARQGLRGDAEAFRGNVAGEPDSWARIVIAGGMPRGIIRAGGEFYAVEAPGDSSVQAASAIIYRLADTYIAPGTMRCGASSTGTAAQMLGNIVGELGTAMTTAPGATRQLDIGAIGDFEFFESKGGDSEAAILTRLNNVDGIYSEQLGVQIHVEELEVFTSAADPFSDATDAGDLLDELGDYRHNTMAQRSQGLTHLYTGRNLDSTTVGIAFLNALCHTRFGAGLTQSSNSVTLDSLIAAHEIGHNFGAPHDGESGSACEAETGTFIMAATFNNSREFSQCSIGQMQPNIDAASCIVSLPTTDVAVEADAALPTVVFLGNTENVVFTVANVGSETATNVAVNVTVPDNVSLDSASISQGSCTSGAGVVDCDVGTVSGGSDRALTLSVTASDVGDGEFVATVTADADDNPDNDQAITRLTVEPAVDLVVHAIAGTQIGLDQNTMVAISLENRSVLNATDVKLLVSLDSGLRADSAAWSLGPCTVTAQQVDCDTDSFPAQSSVTFDLGLTAVSAGQSTYEITLSSAEADANSADNSATGSVTTEAAVASDSSSSGGGGDATGLLSLLLAAGAAICRRRPADFRQSPAPY